MCVHVCVCVLGGGTYSYSATETVGDLYLKMGVFI